VAEVKVKVKGHEIFALLFSRISLLFVNKIGQFRTKVAHKELSVCEIYDCIVTASEADAVYTRISLVENNVGIRILLSVVSRLSDHWLIHLNWPHYGHLRHRPIGLFGLTWLQHYAILTGSDISNVVR